MTILMFPWPDPHLSPNQRHDRRALIGARRAARWAGYVVVTEAGLHLSGVPLEMWLTFLPPDQRKRDLDNLFASMKAYLDGAFKALDLDDSLIERVVLVRGPAQRGGQVLVDIKELPA